MLLLFRPTRIFRRAPAYVRADVRLDFDDDVYLEYHLSHAEHILTKCLERSGSNLLDIFLHGPHAHPDINRVLSRLLTSATRW